MMFRSNILCAILLLALAGAAAASAAVGAGEHQTLRAEPDWPQWDGHEPVAKYAQRAQLQPAESFDLGIDVKLEMALIPAGRFVMGTAEPAKPVEPSDPGPAIAAVSGLIVIAILVFIAAPAIVKRRRPKFSLLLLLALTMSASVTVYGIVRWYKANEAWQQTWQEYETLRARFDRGYQIETPAHAVTLTKPFYMGKFAVTQEQYQQLMGKNPSAFPGRAKHPVETVSWNDATEFCKRLSEKTGRSFRLPTEAEWEYACRAGTTTTYYTGDTETDLARAAWYGANSLNTSRPVGQKEPNGFGLFDMLGNVWQWCQDIYDEYSPGAASDPQGPDKGSERVFRGGSWGYIPGNCRSACRGKGIPANRINVLGFRVVMYASKSP